MSRRDYWNAYYAATEPAAPGPSQFAAFVGAEYLAGRQVIEFGCGNGRDALFFAASGARVIGVDESPAAIALCTREAEERALGDATFLCCGIEHATLPAELAAHTRAGAPRLLYARFFLHAIAEREEERLFEIAAALMSTGDDLFAVEFRTQRDRDLPKATPDHFRRPIDPLQLLARAAARGFRAAYFVEGFGFAKFKHDDAHVARFVFTR